ncbi:MAG: hypothetical protein QY312_01895 [Candidatus Dojkabacteria bacterium]|nr:MAG: hypothetical protein QY312_01895 [Candidatus Dojkabacteria bacterium]
MNNKQAAKKLLELKELDQQYRSEWITGGPEIRLLQEEIDKKNLIELLSIVESIGWPTIPKVGEEAAYAAILIAQHSRDIDTSVKLLEMAKKLFDEDKSNIDGKRLANWIDAMNMQRGIPQIYGQYFLDRGEGYEIYEIEKPEELAKRREEMGLETLEERLHRVLSEYPPEHKITILKSYKRIFGKEFKK